MKEKKLIDEETIYAAVAGEKWAMEKVAEHYSDLIDQYATEKVVLLDGNTKEVINEEKRQELILSLLEAIRNFPLDSKKA